jgi:predicted Zn-dependent protease
VSCVRILFQPVRLCRVFAGVTRRHNPTRGITAGVQWRRAVVTYWHRDGDAARALAEVEPLLSRAPNDPRIQAVMSDAKGAIGDWQGQLAAIQRAIELDPRNTEYLESLGILYVTSRRYAEGIETLQPGPRSRTGGLGHPNEPRSIVDVH